MHNLYGVDSNGNLSYSLGVDTEFEASINTNTGRYVGTAHDSVTNNSGHKQSYVNSGGAFIYDDVVIKHSLYIVDKHGNATLVADGNVRTTGT